MVHSALQAGVDMMVVAEKVAAEEGSDGTAPAMAEIQDTLNW